MTDVARLDGQVAFITGAGRGQGRAHAVRLASEGAGVIAVDICAPIGSVTYPLATREDLDETVRLVEKDGGRIVGHVADVRDMDALQAVYESGCEQLGPCRIVVANAGIMPVGRFGPEARRAWRDTIDVILTGTWNTLQVTVPPMVEAGAGGSVIIISSSAGLKGHTDGSGGWDAYTAAKHGVVGLMRSYAWLLAAHGIRVNSVHPSGVPTPMTMNGAMADYVSSQPDAAARLGNAMPITWIEPEEIAAAVAWLASDESRHVTGITLPVDAGAAIR